MVPYTVPKERAVCRMAQAAEKAGEPPDWNRMARLTGLDVETVQFLAGRNGLLDPPDEGSAPGEVPPPPPPRRRRRGRTAPPAEDLTA